MDVLVQVTLERFQLLHRDPVSGAAIRRHCVVVRQLADPRHGLSHPLVLVFHHRDRVVDGREGGPWWAMVRPGCLGDGRDVGEQHPLFLGHMVGHFRGDRFEPSGHLVQLRALLTMGAGELLQVRGQCRQGPTHPGAR